ncbi:hypothetical protein J6590_085416, partial [Homalodisca vitripennis]
KKCFNKFDDVDRAVIHDSLYSNLHSKDEQDLHLQRMIDVIDVKQYRPKKMMAEYVRFGGGESVPGHETVIPHLAMTCITPPLIYFPKAKTTTPYTCVDFNQLPMLFATFS